MEGLNCFQNKTKIGMQYKHPNYIKPVTEVLVFPFL